MSEKELKLRLHSVYSIGPAEDLANIIASKLQLRTFRSAKVLVHEILFIVVKFLNGREFDPGERTRYLGRRWEAARMIANHQQQWEDEINALEKEFNDQNKLP